MSRHTLPKEPELPRLACRAECRLLLRDKPVVDKFISPKTAAIVITGKHVLTLSKPPAVGEV
jgi:hypothetical protein